MTFPSSEPPHSDGDNSSSTPPANATADTNMESGSEPISDNDDTTHRLEQDATRQSNSASDPIFHIPAASVERRPGTVKCLFLPHGFYAVIPALFSTFAWLSSLTQDGCDYARLTGPIVTEITNNTTVPFLDVGFNQYRVPELDSVTGQWIVDYRLPCEDYDEDFVKMDGYWKVSKGTAFLSLVFGGGGALFLWFSSCFVFSRGTWRWAGYELLAATIFQALSFLWFLTSMCHGSDGTDSCSLYYGSKTDILAANFWGISVLLIFGRYPKATNKAFVSSERRVDGADVPDEVEMTEQTRGDELPLEGHGATETTTRERNDAPSMQTGDHEII
ncbi:hypothetical protein ACHAXS_012498 [Conticribra weissflogii]